MASPAHAGDRELGHVLKLKALSAANESNALVTSCINYGHGKRRSHVFSKVAWICGEQWCCCGLFVVVFDEANTHILRTLTSCPQALCNGRTGAPLARSSNSRTLGPLSGEASGVPKKEESLYSHRRPRQQLRDEAEVARTTMFNGERSARLNFLLVYRPLRH